MFIPFEGAATGGVPEAGQRPGVPEAGQRSKQTQAKQIFRHNQKI